MKRNLCPNCGEQIDVSPAVTEFCCRLCGENLAVSAEGKLVLAHPLRTYLDLDDRENDPGPSPGDEERLKRAVSIFSQRKKKSAQLVYERLGQEKRFAYRGFFFGILFLVFGGTLLLLAYARYLFVADDWVNFAGLGFGLAFVPLGVYIIVWFSLTLRSWSKSEKELEREIRALEEG